MSPSPSVLLVSSSPIARTLYCAALQAEGLQALPAPSGAEALSLAALEQPALILLDLALQTPPAIQVLRDLKSLPDTEHIPVLVIGNTQDTELNAEALEAGATTVLPRIDCTPARLAQTAREFITNTPAYVPSPEASEDRVPTPEAASPAPRPEPTPTPAEASLPSPRTAARSAAAAISSLRDSFQAAVSTRIGELHPLLQSALKDPGSPEIATTLSTLSEPVRELLFQSVLIGNRPFAQLAEGIDNLTQDLLERPEQVKFSPLRTLTFAVERLRALATARTYRPDGTKPRPTPLALIVDDDTLVSRVISQALERGKLNSVRVLNPKTALELCEFNRFDLFLLDINMPEMNGLELCVKIRATSGHDSATVIFVTGVQSPELRTYGGLAGGTDFVTKPFLASELCLKALTHLSKLNIPPVG